MRTVRGHHVQLLSGDVEYWPLLIRDILAQPETFWPPATVLRKKRKPSFSEWQSEAAAAIAAAQQEGR